MAKLGRPINDPTERIIKICAGNLVYDKAAKTWMCKNVPVSDYKVCLFLLPFNVPGSVMRYQKRLQRLPAFQREKV